MLISFVPRRVFNWLVEEDWFVDIRSVYDNSLVELLI